MHWTTLQLYDRTHTLSEPELETQTQLREWTIELNWTAIKTKLNPYPLHLSLFIPPLSWHHTCHWHITMWCSYDVKHNYLHHHLTIQCSDDIMLFLAGNPSPCIIVLEWQFLTQSMSASASTLTIPTWRLIVTPGAYCDTYMTGQRDQVPIWWDVISQLCWKNSRLSWRESRNSRVGCQKCLFLNILHHILRKFAERHLIYYLVQ